MNEVIALSLSILALVATSACFGVTLLLSYVVARMLRSDGWDRSNVTNALRLIAHMTMHPEDFNHMYYTVSESFGTRVATRKAFPYLGKDELSEVVATRPTTGETR